MYNLNEAFDALNKLWEAEEPSFKRAKPNYKYAYTHMDRFLDVDNPEDFDRFYEIKDAAELANFIKANIDEIEFYNRAGNNASIEEFAKYIIDNHLNEGLNDVQDASSTSNTDTAEKRLLDFDKSLMTSAAGDREISRPKYTPRELSNAKSDSERKLMDFSNELAFDESLNEDVTDKKERVVNYYISLGVKDIDSVLFPGEVVQAINDDYYEPVSDWEEQYPGEPTPSCMNVDKDGWLYTPAGTKLTMVEPAGVGGEDIFSCGKDTFSANLFINGKDHFYKQYKITKKDDAIRKLFLEASAKRDIEDFMNSLE